MWKWLYHDCITVSTLLFFFKQMSYCCEIPGPSCINCSFEVYPVRSVDLSKTFGVHILRSVLAFEVCLALLSICRSHPVFNWIFFTERFYWVHSSHYPWYVYRAIACYTTPKHDWSIPCLMVGVLYPFFSPNMLIAAKYFNFILTCRRVLFPNATFWCWYM